MRILVLIALLLILNSTPAVALDIGQRAGPVLLNEEAAICDTMGEAVEALNVLDDDEGTMPVGCGTLAVSLPAFLEVVGHLTTSKGTYAILKILFLPPAGLGVQYGWIIDKEAPKGISL